MRRDLFAEGLDAYRRGSWAEAKAAFGTAKSDVALWETRLGFGKITAPAAGMVTSKLVEAGSAVSPNQQMLELRDESVVGGVVGGPVGVGGGRRWGEWGGVRRVPSGSGGGTGAGKRWLARPPRAEMRPARGVTPLGTCLENLAASLGQSYEGGSPGLELPLAPLPLDLAAQPEVDAVVFTANKCLEGVPGVAKTLTATTPAQAVSAEVQRIQLTPDRPPAGPHRPRGTDQAKKVQPRRLRGAAHALRTTGWLCDGFHVIGLPRAAARRNAARPQQTGRENDTIGLHCLKASKTDWRVPIG